MDSPKSNDPQRVTSLKTNCSQKTNRQLKSSVLPKSNNPVRSKVLAKPNISLKTNSSPKSNNCSIKPNLPMQSYPSERSKNLTGSEHSTPIRKQKSADKTVKPLEKSIVPASSIKFSIDKQSLTNVITKSSPSTSNFTADSNISAKKPQGAITKISSDITLPSPLNVIKKRPSMSLPLNNLAKKSTYTKFYHSPTASVTTSKEDSNKTSEDNQPIEKHYKKSLNGERKPQKELSEKTLVKASRKAEISLSKTLLLSRCSNTKTTTTTTSISRPSAKTATTTKSSLAESQPIHEIKINTKSNCNSINNSIIILDDDSDEETSQPKSATQSVRANFSPNVRLENVVGKLLKSSTGKQSVVRVINSDSPVRNSFLTNANTVSPQNPTASPRIVAETGTSQSQRPLPSTLKVKPLSKKARIALLEKKLETLEKRINKFAEHEVSLEEMEQEESAYIQEAKLKEEFVRSWRIYCKLIGEDPDAAVSTRKKVKVHSAPFPEINREVERYINRSNTFPNLFDIKSVCMQANNKHHLDMKSCDVHSIAVDVFTEVGRKLQKNREKELRANSGNILTDLALQMPDPALEDANLKLKLKRNRKIAKKKTEDVFQDYVRQQYEQMGEGRNDESETSAGEEDDAMESLRRNNLIENKKIKQKLIKNKINGGGSSSTATSSKKSKRTENTTVINVTLSSSQEEPSNQKNINCHVTFNASPKQPSTSTQVSAKPLSGVIEEEVRPTNINAAKFKESLKNSVTPKRDKTSYQVHKSPKQLTKNNSPQPPHNRVQTENTSNHVHKSLNQLGKNNLLEPPHKRVLAEKLEDASHFPGFLSEKRPLESTSKLSVASPLGSVKAHASSTSYESPLKRFRSISGQQPSPSSSAVQPQQTTTTTNLPVSSGETVESKTKPIVKSYRLAKPQQDTGQIVIIDSDDDDD